MNTYECSMDGCDNKFKRTPSGVAGKTYLYCSRSCQAAHKKLLPLPNCTTCGEQRQPQKGSKGLCQKCYDKARARSKTGSAEWQENRNKRNAQYQDNIEFARHRSVVYKYGIPFEKYQEMFESQGGKCAICNRHRDEFQKNFAVDHDHSCCKTTRGNPRTCGRCVRALLCVNCNQGLGCFRDDKESLSSAINYLQKWEVQSL